MDGSRGNMFICVKCGCHLQSSFRFCPKCGMQVRGHLQGERESHTQVQNPESSSRFQTKLSFPNFEKYKSLKEQDRRGFDNRSNTRKKKRIAIESVLIRVEVMNQDMTPRRGETLPVKVPSSATPDEIVQAAVAKHTAFNKRFQHDANYRLTFKDGTEVRFVPGISPAEPFTLKRYKDESGYGYSKITLFIRPVGNIVQQLQQIIESDSDTSSDGGNFNSNVDKPAFLGNERAKAEIKPVEQSDSPSCQQRPKVGVAMCLNNLKFLFWSTVRHVALDFPWRKSKSMRICVRISLWNFQIQIQPDCHLQDKKVCTDRLLSYRTFKNV